MKVRLFYLYKLFENFVPVYPVYLLLFEQRGIPVSDISLLLSIWSLSVVLLEVPSGILADYWSRKHMIVLAALFKAIGYGLWIFADSFFLFALGFLLWGVSCSFASGSEEALLYDTLKEYNEEDKFDEVYGKGSFYGTVGIVAAMVIGGIISQYFGIKWALIVSIFSMLSAACIASRLKESNVFAKENASEVSSKIKEFMDTLKEASLLCLKNKDILIVICISIFVVGTSGVLDEYDQLVASNYGLGLGLVGIWGAVRYMMAGIGSLIAHKLRMLFEKTWAKDRFFTLLQLCLIGSIFLGVAGFVGHIAIMPIYGLYFLVMATASTLHEDYIQQKVTGEGRATVHSLISLAYNIYGILFYAIFSWVLRYYNMHTGLVFVAVYMIACSIVLYIGQKFNFSDGK